ARMNMFEKAFKKIDKGQFTERIFGLEETFMYGVSITLHSILV
ncbi:hypothetical protein, partial [Staphylococcus pseudintermedius]